MTQESLSTETSATSQVEAPVIEEGDSGEQMLIFEHPEDSPEDKEAIAKLKEPDVTKPDGDKGPSGAEGKGDAGGKGEEPTPKPAGEDGKTNAETKPDQKEGWNQPATFRVYGRDIPADGFKVSGPNAERVFALAQKGMAADVALADVAEQRKAIEGMKPVLEKLRTDAGFREYVLRGLTGQTTQRQGHPEESDQLQGEDAELEAALSRSPMVRKLMQDKTDLEAQLGEINGTVGPMAQEQELKGQVDQAANRVAELGFDKGEFMAAFPTMNAIYWRLAASPDPGDRAKAQRLDNDPNAWVEFFMANKARGASFGGNRAPAPQNTPQQRGEVETTHAPKTPLPRDSSRVEPTGNDTGLTDLLNKALETGTDEDIEAVITAKLGG